MLGRNGNIAYVRYDSQGRIVSGGPIISPYRPKVGNWQPVSKVIGNSVITSNSLRAFIRLDAYGRVVPSSLLLLSQAPSDADSGTYWLEINATYRPYVAPTTSTTTSTSTTIVPPTTSTTTTNGGTSVTAWFGQVSFTGPSDTWRWKACNGFGNNIIVYTNTTSITAGTYLYTDTSLTTLIFSPGAISFPATGLVFELVNGQTNPLGGNGVPCGSITTTTSTTMAPTYFYVSTSQSMTCINDAPQIPLTPQNIFSPFCYQETYNGDVSMYPNGTLVYVKDPVSGLVKSYTTWGTYLQVNSNCTSCP